MCHEIDLLQLAAGLVLRPATASRYKAITYTHKKSPVARALRAYTKVGLIPVLVVAA